MTPSAVRKIIHIDMDAFFASVEQRDHPELRGKPVAVGHAGPRGVVAAASYEARAFGVRSALPSVTAIRRCPDLIFVRSRFDVYRAVSAQIHAIFAEYSDLVQPLSLDEAYLDVTANRRGIETAWATAKEIRARIHADTGLTASAGISYNKFLAKLASDHRKPDGQFAVTPDMGADWVAGLPVARFHGVGPVTAAKMKRLGIETGAQLRAKSLAFLKANFGSSAEWYHAIARGVDDRAVNPNRDRKSSGTETTFDRDLTDPAEIEPALLRLADEMADWCESRAMFGRTVTVRVKFADFRQVTRSRTVASGHMSREAIAAAATALLRSLYPLDQGVRLMGVTISKWAEAEASELPLFDDGGAPATSG